MSSRTRLLLPLAALTAIPLLTASPRAHACTPLPEGVFSTIPAEGQKYPANAAVILQGQGISLTDASVTVDGKPATLKDVSTTLLSETDLFGVTVEPTPVAGQNVVITGTFCGVGSGCPMVALHYLATAAIAALPPPVEPVGFDVYDYPDFKSGGGDCQSDSDFAWWVRLKSPIPDPAKDGAVMYVIEGYTPAQSEGPTFKARGFVTASWNPVVTIRQYVGILGGEPLPESTCFSVETYDSAGNHSSSVKSLCKPCNYRADMVPISGLPPAEPMWTAADIYPGGMCDSLTTGTGGASAGAGGSGGGKTAGDQVVGGCGCSVTGEEAPISGIFGALVLALGAMMRIVRRRR